MDSNEHNPGLGEDIEAIKAWLHPDAVRQAGEHPQQILKDVRYALLQNISCLEAVEILYRTAIIIQQPNLFKNQDRLWLKDDFIKLVHDWLGHYFERRATELNNNSAGKLFAVFSLLDHRMPETIHHVLKQFIRDKHETLKIRDRARILGYYAHTVDRLDPDIYALTEYDLLVIPKNMPIYEQQDLAETLAILDGVYPPEFFGQARSPRKIFESLEFSKSCRPRPARGLDLALCWFNGYINPYTVSIKELEIISQKILQLQEKANKAGFVCIEGRHQINVSSQPHNKNGLDIIGEYNNASIGIVLETRTKFIEQHTDPVMIFPSGNSLLQAKIIHRAEPDCRVIKIPTFVAKHLSPPQLEGVFKRVVNQNPGVYGVNYYGEVVPFRDFSLGLF